ncbi:MAG: serine hydrolase family protein [Candidatus Moranbacteria bacterium]|nr:serine hydrolase family protein [Candidatus Moranbacteria bacterium]
MKKRVFIIHGWESNPTEHWFPWLKLELEENGFEVSVPEMPNAFFPKQEEWVSYLAEIIGEVNENTFLIGHSLGVITILRFLESLGGDQKIGGIILVAGFSESLGIIPEIENFFEKQVDYDKVKSHCKNFVTINSDDDPWVPVEKGEIIHNILGGEFKIFQKCGHFSLGTGNNEFPELIEELLKIAK